jgi:hypothetical protein
MVAVERTLRLGVSYAVGESQDGPRFILEESGHGLAKVTPDRFTHTTSVFASTS